jgi:CBS domain-containing protein
MTVDRLLREKGTEVVTIAPQATVGAAVQVMAKHNIGVIIVSEDGRALDGIVAERDIVWALAEFGMEALGMPTSAIMTAKVFVCHPVDPLDEIVRIMTEHKIRHMPVIVEDKLRGLVSIGDVVSRQQRDRESALLDGDTYRRRIA